MLIIVSVNVDDFNTSRFNIGALIVNSRMTNRDNEYRTNYEHRYDFNELTFITGFTESV